MRTIRGLIVAVCAALMCVAPPPITAAESTPRPQQQAEMPLFVFTYRPGPAWRAGVPMKQQGLGPHGKYMQSLLDSGTLILAGGFADNDGGMAIITAANADDARRMLAADPAIVAGIFKGEVEEWRPRFRASGALPNR